MFLIKDELNGMTTKQFNRHETLNRLPTLVSRFFQGLVLIALETKQKDELYGK
jgi:hypothetical protein